MVTTSICLLSVYLDEAMLIDVALVYGLLSFLAVVIICHVVTLHHKGRQLHLKQKEEEKKMREIFGMIFIFMGIVVFLISLLGIYRLKYVMNRMHAAQWGTHWDLALWYWGRCSFRKMLFKSGNICW